MTWVLEPDGVHIHEWPRFALLGFSRRAVVSYGEIRALRRNQTALDAAGAELMTLSGKTYYLPAAFGPWSKVPPRRALPAGQCETDLGRFLQAIQTKAAAHGNAGIRIAQGLDFWSRAPGLMLLSIFLMLTLIVAGGVVWMLIDGFTAKAPARNTNMAMAILIALPFGVIYMLRRSFRRRALVDED